MQSRYGVSFDFGDSNFAFRLQPFPARLQKKNIVLPIAGLGDSLQGQTYHLRFTERALKASFAVCI